MKRTHKEIRKAILEILKDTKSNSYGSLERKVNTNWITIRDHVEDLILFGMAGFEDGKIIITETGRELLERL